MLRLVLILLGIDYLRRHLLGMYVLGLAFALGGVLLIVDSLDQHSYFPVGAFAVLLLVGGAGTLAIGAVSRGSLRAWRIVEGVVLMVAAVLVMTGRGGGGFWLSMIFGTLFFLDGLLQALSAVLVRYPRWRVAFAVGLCELAIAISFYTPWPFAYQGTVPYALGLALIFIGWGMAWLAARVRLLDGQTSVEEIMDGALYKPARPSPGHAPVSDTIGATPPSLYVYVWTPATAMRAAPMRRRPVIDRYVAAVDSGGAVWTGHVALGAAQLYISLDPAAPIKRSVEDLRMLHAAAYNNVEGHFQSDYQTDAQLRGPSTYQIPIHNFDPDRLQAFWTSYRQDRTYNLTRRNCAASVARALEVSVDGALSRLHGKDPGWRLFFGLLLTPEVWVAAQIRKRAKTMAWTPGLVLDYTRALSMLVDPTAAEETDAMQQASVGQRP